jgi:hypothetical protein
MGCCESKDLKVYLSEEKLIKDAERLLGFENLDSKRIVQVIEGHSYQSQLSKPDLQSALRDLRVSYNAGVSFYDRFSYMGMYSTKKISCLGILLGSSSFVSKIKLIFDIYDTEESKILMKSDIEIMISHIIFISLSAVPSFSITVWPDEESLQIYSSKLNLFINSLFKHFTYLIIGSDRELNYKKFKEKFMNETVLYLLSGKKLREYCCRLLSNSNELEYGARVHKLKRSSTPLSNHPENELIRSNTEILSPHNLSVS